MVGHLPLLLGAIENVATVLQLKHQFIFPNLNSGDVHPDKSSESDTERKIPTKMTRAKLNIIAKASFGFGDVNASVLFLKILTIHTEFIFHMYII